MEIRHSSACTKLRDQIRGEEDLQHLKVSLDSGIPMLLLLEQDRCQSWLHSSFDVKKGSGRNSSLSESLRLLLQKLWNSFTNNSGAIKARSDDNRHMMQMDFIAQRTTESSEEFFDERKRARLLCWDKAIFQDNGTTAR